MAVHYSSKNNLWSTPQDFFDKYNKIHKFTLDACASRENFKCDNYYTIEDNSLTKIWHGTVWMNPPYGRKIGLWLKKAYDSSLQGAKVVCLIPSRTDTKWWHEYAMNGEIEFIKGRLKFGGAKHNAPFPSVVVVFNAPI